ncbi:MAG TPA: DUF481 domain-containing protein [Nitrospiria bacterium]
MKVFPFLFPFLALLIIAPVAYGEEEIKKISDDSELGYVDSSGNTDVTTFILNNTFKFLPSDHLEGTWKLNLLYSETDGEKKGQRYGTDLRAEYKFTQRAYSFGLASWLRDKFAGVDSRLFFGGGAGYRLLTGPKHKLLGEAGLNYTLDEFTDKYLTTKFPMDYDRTNDYVGGRVFGEYAYFFTKKNRFTAWIEYLPDFEDDGNYNVNGEAALISALNGFLSLKASYLVKYDNEPPLGATDTDKILSLNLVVNMI